MNIPEELLPVIEWWERDGKKTLAVAAAAGVVALGVWSWMAHREQVRQNASTALINAGSDVEALEAAVAKYGDMSVGPSLKVRLAMAAFSTREEAEVRKALQIYDELIAAKNMPAGYEDIPVVGRAECLEALGEWKQAYDAYTTYLGGEENKTNAFMYELKNISSNVFVLLKHIIEELSQSDFDVADCELNISGEIPEYTVKLKNGRTVSVRGSVDRVDVMEKDGVKYLRVIDYKTGPKEFKLSDVLYGVNLQMLIYLHSIDVTGKQRYGEITPSAVLYMPAAITPVSADNLADDQIKKELNKKLKMKGVVLDDRTVLHGMDKTDSATYIPVKLEFSGRDIFSRLTAEEFNAVFNRIDVTIGDMGDRLYDGKIEASPLKGAYDGCTYCPYDSVCAYRQSEPRNAVTGFDKQKLIEELSKKGGELNA